MAKNKDYSVGLSLKDQITGKLKNIAGDLNKLDKQIDTINGKSLKIKAETNNGYKDIVNRINRDIPSEKRIKITAQADITRDLNRIEKQTIDVNRRIQQTLDSNMRKAMQGIKQQQAAISRATQQMSMSTSIGRGSSGYGSGYTGGKGGFRGGYPIIIGTGGKVTGSGKNTDDDDDDDNGNGDNGFISGIREKIRNVINRAKSIVDKLKNPLKDIAKGIGNKFSGAFNRVKDYTSRVTDKIKEIKDFASAYKNTTLSIMGDKFKRREYKKNGAESTFGQKMSNLKSNVGTFFNNRGSDIYDLLSGNRNSGKKGINFILSVTDRATPVIKSVYNGAKALIKGPFRLFINVKDEAKGAIKGIYAGAKSLTKQVWRATVTVIDKARPIISKVSSALKSIGGKIFKATVAVADKASGMISGIFGKLKWMAAGITVPIGFAIKGGMDLEKQMVSMEHWMKKLNNPDTYKEDAKNYSQSLIDYANRTPFETGDVMGGGARALNIGGGNADKAMEIMRMAGNMASVTPGKTIEMALEALADLKNGETARLECWPAA